MKNLYASLVALLISSTINAQIIDIPDANFKNALVNTNCVSLDNSGNYTDDVDTNDDGEIQVSEAEAVYNILSFEQDYNISSIEGIEYFINMTTFAIINNNIDEINISNLPNLDRIHLALNNSTSIILNNLPNLRDLACLSNPLLTSLDISNCNNIEGISCWGNQLSTLNLDNFNNLKFLNISSNNFTILNIPNSINLERLYCADNQLTTLDLSNQNNITILNCENNLLSSLNLGIQNDLNNLDCNNNLVSSLDLSNVNSLEFFINISNNSLNSLFIKNGNNHDMTCLDPCNSFIFDNNPNLSFICVDNDYEAAYMQTLLDEYGYTECAINSYCSFDPGGEFYTIEGNVTIDIDTNGCDINDVVFPNLNFDITDGTETGNFIANSSGVYTIPVQDGTYTITPILENLDYFNVSPPSIVVAFPTEASPFIQDFCITPNGVHKDIDIQILPLTAATPGFQANYRIIYKNTGNTLIDFGQVLLTNDFDLMSEVSFNPNWDSFTLVDDTWHFNFEDLQPFETRTVDFSMLINTPMDTPSVNGGDVLTFNANYFIEYELVDSETAFVLEQTVVNSFDPNDKTCLEGDIISPEQVGDYVHYMIRFENTGTANAVNIVVKDHIDISKFDLSSLVPLHASHNYFARIKDNTTEHYIEFIFENINLPFDDTNNDGYIVFKIKTSETLILNDTFENDAEIYFDFNFPIITNNEQTTVATLSTEEFELANNLITLYPNPTTHNLHLESKQAIQQITVYDIFGRSIKEITIIGSKTELTISTEELSTGTYFVKIKTETSEVVKKIIKD